MPFTVGLGPDRGRNGLAPCAPLLHKGFWGSQPWDIRKIYCRTCPYRFNHRPSCNTDFLNVGQTDLLKSELSLAMGRIASTEMDWAGLPRAVHEVELAYYYIGLEMPGPKQVLSAFIGSCANVEPDEQFWKEWNYFGVEQRGANPVKLKITGPMKEEVNKLTLNVIEPQRYQGKRLLHLYAASAVLEEVSAILSLPTLHEVYSTMVEACRRAVTANASLEVS